MDTWFFDLHVSLSYPDTDSDRAQKYTWIDDMRENYKLYF